MDITIENTNMNHLIGSHKQIEKIATAWSKQRNVQMLHVITPCKTDYCKFHSININIADCSYQHETYSRLPCYEKTIHCTVDRDSLRGSESFTILFKDSKPKIKILLFLGQERKQDKDNQSNNTNNNHIRKRNIEYRKSNRTETTNGNIHSHEMNCRCPVVRHKRTTQNRPNI